MPELPDVEVFRKQAEKALDRKIVKVNARKSRVLKVSESTLRKHLLGNTFKGTARHGKYLFLKISDGYELVMHFGMTGYLAFGEVPKHSVLSLDMEGERLSFVNVRKLGRLDVIRNREDYIKKQGLGPDALEMKRKEFVDMLEKKNGSIKGALMDQSSISGIGNIYSDEVLYQAGIYPGRKTESVKDKGRLYDIMVKVLETAIKVEARAEKMPKDWLLRRRKPGSKCGKCSGSIEKRSINGRSAYFCNKHQR